MLMIFKNYAIYKGYKVKNYISSPSCDFIPTPQGNIVSCILV